MTLPVHIIAGHLRAGKTSVIRAQLERSRGERVSVIVNEFGEASLDESGPARPAQRLDIPHACGCCTAPAGFIDALGAVLAEKPDRLLIESAGAARPQDLVDTIRRCPQRDALETAPVTLVVDPEHYWRADAAARTRIDEQLHAADLLLLNGEDRFHAEQAQRLQRIAQNGWPAPRRILHTRHGHLQGPLPGWEEREGARLPQGRSSESPLGEEQPGLRLLRWRPQQVFERERLDAAARSLLEAGVRLRGVFRTREGVLLLRTDREGLHSETSAWRSDSRAELSVDGQDAARFENARGLLDAAQLREEELHHSAEEMEWVLADGDTRVVRRETLAALPGGTENIGAHFEKYRGAAAGVDALWRALQLPEGGFAVVCAQDGMVSEALPTQALRRGWLVHSLHGEPLPQKQGGPFRLLIPPDVQDAPSTCSNVKGVVRVVLRARAS